jgi:hypothetical protein
VCPTRRTPAPSRCATPSQVAARPRPRAANSVAIGPGPFRTALGAGRLDLLEVRRFDEDFLRVWLPDDRVLEAAELLALLFDDAGGEDVRVAMVRIYAIVTSVTPFTRRTR